MAVVSDTFTEASDTDLTSHTPDTGSAWVQVAILGTTKLRVIAATDVLGAAGSATGNGELCKSQPSPSGADYDAALRVTAVDTGSASRFWRIHGRMTDGDNSYFVELAPTGHANNDVTLYKIVSGTKTSLATVDTGLAANDIITLSMSGTTIRVLKNGAQILSVTDSALSAAGDAGISAGKYNANIGTANINSSSWAFDDYSVTEAAPAGALLTHRGMAGGMRDLVGGIRG